MGLRGVDLRVWDSCGWWEIGGEVIRFLWKFDGYVAAIPSVVDVGGPTNGVAGGAAGCPALLDGTVGGFVGDFVGVAESIFGMNSPVKSSETKSISSYISGHEFEFKLEFGLGN